MPYLMLLNERAIPSTGWELGVEPMSFGSGDEANVKVDDAALAPVHFLVNWDGGKHFIVDQESETGTRVNDGKVRRKVLKAGDMIRAGNSTFHYDVGMSTMLNQAENQSGKTIQSQLSDLYKDLE